jgi:hypothetical protein
MLAIGIVAGLMLFVSGVRSNVPPPTHSRTPTAANVRLRFMRAAILGLGTLAVTRWPVAAIACSLLGWFSADLLGGKPNRDAGVARTEAIASWTEMLRDTIAAAHGLEAAITATAPVAPEPIRPEVMSLAIAIEREPLTRALAHLADELAHPIADLVVSALMIAASGSVRELAELLGTLAAAARDEAAMQLRVEAARARMRTAIRVITGCTIVTAAGLVVLNPGYVGVYSTAVGQITLALISICWGGALWWLARISEFRTPQRFLLGEGASLGPSR